MLHLLSDPNIAFILFTIGFYGIFFELQNPNWVTGILGGIAIILAFIGFGSLPLNIGGLLLIGLGIVLFVLEFTVTSHGLLTVAGIVCFVLGAAALYTEPGTPTAPDVSVGIPVIVAMTVRNRHLHAAHHDRRDSHAPNENGRGTGWCRAAAQRHRRGPPAVGPDRLRVRWWGGVDCPHC